MEGMLEIALDRIAAQEFDRPVFQILKRRIRDALMATEGDSVDYGPFAFPISGSDTLKDKVHCVVRRIVQEREK